MDPAALPNAADRIDAQYKLFGAKTVYTDILGARSIVERWNNQPNAEDGLKTRQAAGFDGCWVLAMGLNEAANQAVGGNTPLDKRIDILMQHVGNEPVMWLTVKTLLTKTAYAENQMVKFNDALVRGLSAVPQHAGLRLGGRGPGQLVRQGQDALHQHRLEGAGAPDRRGARGRLPEGRTVAEHLPDP